MQHAAARWNVRNALIYHSNSISDRKALEYGLPFAPASLLECIVDYRCWSLVTGTLTNCWILSLRWVMPVVIEIWESVGWAVKHCCRRRFATYVFTMYVRANVWSIAAKLYIWFGQRINETSAKKVNHLKRYGNLFHRELLMLWLVFICFQHRFGFRRTWKSLWLLQWFKVKRFIYLNENELIAFILMNNFRLFTFFKTWLSSKNGLKVCKRWQTYQESSTA